MNNVIEIQCLNYILNKKNLSFITYNNLDESYFTTYLNEYRFIKDHYDKYNNVPDKETIIGVFPDFEFLDVTENEQYLLKELKELYLYRLLVPDVNKIVDLMSVGKTDEAIGHLTKAASKIHLKETVDPIDLISQASIRYDEYLEKCNNPVKAYITTGLSALDEVLGGWDRKEELAIISGKTNTGKSWYTLYFALHAAMKGLKVGFYSGEMEPSKIGYRLDSFLFNLSNYGLTHGDLNLQNSYKDLLETLKDKVSGQILVATPDMFDGYATVSKLKAFVEKNELDMLVIDQISLMEDERKSKIKHEAYANIARDLKNLQVMKHIPIIVAAQLNREEADKGLTIDNIAGSYDIMRYATTALLLEQKDKDDSKIKRLTITVGKARDARAGSKLTYMWDINYGKLTFVPTENDATNGKHIEELKETFGDINTEENVF